MSDEIEPHGGGATLALLTATTEARAELVAVAAEIEAEAETHPLVFALESAAELARVRASIADLDVEQNEREALVAHMAVRAQLAEVSRRVSLAIAQPWAGRL